MGIVNRFARMMKADIHGMLDIIEDPRETLKQALREMEEAIAEREAQLAQIELQSRNISERSKQLSDELRRISDQLNVCLETANDDLARSIIRRKLSVEAAIVSSTEQRKILADRQQVMVERLNAERERLRAIGDKVKLFPACVDSHDYCEHGAQVPGINCISDEDVEVALLQEKKRRTTSVRAAQ